MEKIGVMMISLLFMAVAIIAQEHNNEILDTDGHKVEVGEQYYVIEKAAYEELSEERVVSYSSRSTHALCPRIAVVPNDAHSSPLPTVPVSFSPENRDTNVVYESFPLSVKFEVSHWSCNSQKTTFWTVNNRSIVTPYSEITFGGKPNTKLTNFTIEREGEDGYKFVHVDNLTGKKSVIGVQSVQQFGYRRLVLLDEKKPFVVVFKNANVLFKRSSLLSMVPFYNSFK